MPEHPATRTTPTTSTSRADSFNKRTKGFLQHRRWAHVAHSVQRTTSAMCRGMNYAAVTPRFCPCCMAGNSTLPVLPKSRADPAQLKFERVHTDLWGPMQAPTEGDKDWYGIAFTDEATRYTVVYTMQKKDHAVFALTRFMAEYVAPADATLNCIQADGGGEFVGDEFTSYCEARGINLQHSAPRKQSQNGIAERKWGTLGRMVRRMLHDAKLPPTYWGFALKYATQIMNRTATRALDGYTPYEAFYGKQPDASMFRVFGSPMYVHVDGKKRQKLDSLVKPYVFVGIPENYKCWTGWCHQTKKSVRSGHVTFNERVNDSTPSLDLLYGISGDRRYEPREWLPAAAAYEEFHEPDFPGPTPAAPPICDTYRTMNRGESSITGAPARATNGAGTKGDAAGACANPSTKHMEVPPPLLPATAAALAARTATAAHSAASAAHDRACRALKAAAAVSSVRSSTRQRRSRRLLPPTPATPHLQKEEDAAFQSSEPQYYRLPSSKHGHTVRSVAKHFGVDARKYHYFIQTFAPFGPGEKFAVAPFQARRPTVWTNGTDVPVPNGNCYFDFIVSKWSCIMQRNDRVETAALAAAGSNATVATVAVEQTAMASDFDTPRTATQALRSPQCDRWVQSMLNEINELLSNKTWDFWKIGDVKSRFPNHTIIKTKWVYKVKQNGDGSVNKFKSRLVAAAWNAVEGVDYMLSYAPVLRFASMRALLAKAARIGYQVFQLDIKNAYVLAMLPDDEFVFVEQAPGCVKLDENGQPFILRLRRGLYGLVQSGRLFADLLTDKLVNDLGFTRSQYDTCVYTRDNITLGVYVDDLVLLCPARRSCKGRVRGRTRQERTCRESQR
jgi:transposase InsO family protein